MPRARKYVEPEVEKELTEESPAQVETTGPETKYGTITNAALVNVRKKPSLGSEVLEVLARGEKVKVLGKSGGFYKVSTRLNRTAYISSNFIEEG